MKIGVLGGTFDPIHLGHLRAAENAREGLGLDRILLVPAGTPPHRAQTWASAHDRFAMVCLAAATHSSFVAVDDEIRRSGPSYTVDTLGVLRTRFPGADLHLIVGSDTARDLRGWKDPERLLSLCRIAVVGRPGGLAIGAKDMPHDLVPGDGLPISATDLRKRAREGRSLRYLVCDAVANYIERKGLYR